MQKLAVLAMAGLMSVTASATNWLLIHKSSELTRYIDVDSISDSGKYKTFFIRNIYETPYLAAPYALVDQTLSFSRFDCKSNPKKFQVLSVVSYNDNKVVRSTGYDENGEWYVVYPGTIAETQAIIVCAR